MFDSLFPCILDAAHDRILSVRTSYSHYFTNCYEATNLRNLLIYHYWSNFNTKYLLRGSFFRYLFSEHSFSEIFEESNIPSLNFQKIILKFSCCRNKKSLEILICCGNLCISSNLTLISFAKSVLIFYSVKCLSLVLNWFKVREIMHFDILFGQNTWLYETPWIWNRLWAIKQSLFEKCNPYNRKTTAVLQP